LGPEGCQYPRWEYDLDKETAKLLGDWRGPFRHGLACEAESFGLAACSYYRWIVERMIETLITERRAAMVDADRAAFDAQVVAARESRQMGNLIGLAKDQLPADARPGDANPLIALYDPLSELIHRGTDDTCMERVAELRELLVALLRQIANAGESRKYAERLRAVQRPRG
jgi:hypothetical protein